eukprot:2102509-Prymnesium_polylepis.1
MHLLRATLARGDASDAQCCTANTRPTGPLGLASAAAEHSCACGSLCAMALAEQPPPSELGYLDAGTRWCLMLANESSSVISGVRLRAGYGKGNGALGNSADRNLSDSVLSALTCISPSRHFGFRFRVSRERPPR